MRSPLSFITLVAFLLIASFMFSCRATRDNKAVKRVKANIDLLNDVGKAWEKLNPCYPDTIKIGEVVTIIDSSYAKENIRELNTTIEFLFGLLGSNKEVNVDSIKSEIRKEVEKNCKPKTIYSYRIDTMPSDKRIENILREDLSKAALEISNLNGQDHQKSLQIKELKAAKKKSMWWTIGGGFGLLAIIGGLSFLLFKKK